MAGPCRLRSELRPRGVFELLGITARLLPRVPCGAAVDPDTPGPRFVACTRSLEAVIGGRRHRPWRADIVTKIDERPRGCANQRGHRIGRLEADLLRRVVLGELPADEIDQVRLACSLSHQGDHPIAPMDSQPLGYRSNRVRRIEVAPIIASHLTAPGERAVPLEHERAAIVYVTALGIGEVAENALANHVADHHQRFPVAAILREHVHPSALLGGPHQAPAVRQGHRRGDLAQDMLSRGRASIAMGA